MITLSYGDYLMLKEVEEYMTPSSKITLRKKLLINNDYFVVEVIPPPLNESKEAHL